MDETTEVMAAPVRLLSPSPQAAMKGGGDLVILGQLS
jgi:hypothetical protein